MYHCHPRRDHIQGTPIEDPWLVSIYVLQYVYGLEQVTTIGSVKAISFKGSSCCKHYAAYDFDKWNGMGQFNCLAMVAYENLKNFTQIGFYELKVPQTSSSMCKSNNGTYI
ncbi:beta-D-xylosidase [Trifolium repens]|nr:beta-D-xylosidase [Trifolium repens]